MLTRDQILSAQTRPVVEVDCPDLGGKVCLRQLSGAEMVQVYGDERPTEQVVPALVALSLCDENGARMFKAEDHGELYAAHPAHVLQPIIEKALEINRLTKEAVDAARKA